MARRLLTIPGIVLIALAATLWGTDALFRRPLAQSTSATTIVFGEHVLLVALTLPFLIPALRGLIGAGWRYIARGNRRGRRRLAVATTSSRRRSRTAIRSRPSSCRRFSR